MRENAATDVRRTAAVAAPILAKVALAGSLLGAPATLNEAQAAEIREQTAADFVITATDGAGFTPATVARLREVPGTVVSAPSSAAVYTLEEGVALIKSEARAADPRALAATTRLPVTAGKVRDLDDGSIIVNEEWEKHTVGQHVDVWLGDGTKETLRIAAVLSIGTGDNGVYVTPRNAAGAAVDRVDVTLAKGAARSAVAKGLHETVRSTGAEVVTKSQWIQSSYPKTNHTTRLGILLVLGIALVYTAISLTNTMITATADRARARDLASLRLAGATKGQVLRMVAAEALLVVTVGAVLGLVTTALNLLPMWIALAILAAPASLQAPWLELTTTVTACTLLAVPSALAATRVVLRRGAVGLAGVHE